MTIAELVPVGLDPEFDAPVKLWIALLSQE